jgi:transposase
MDDKRCRKFFCRPTTPSQRRYEALRAVFVEGQSQREAAEQFGFEYTTMRQWVYEFRRYCGHARKKESPFFAS